MSSTEARQDIYEDCVRRLAETGLEIIERYQNLEQELTAEDLAFGNGLASQLAEPRIFVCTLLAWLRRAGLELDDMLESKVVASVDFSNEETSEGSKTETSTAGRTVRITARMSGENKCTSYEIDEGPGWNPPDHLVVLGQLLLSELQRSSRVPQIFDYSATMYKLKQIICGYGK